MSLSSASPGFISVVSSAVSGVTGGSSQPSIQIRTTNSLSRDALGASNDSGLSAAMDALSRSPTKDIRGGGQSPPSGNAAPRGKKEKKELAEVLVGLAVELGLLVATGCLASYVINKLVKNLNQNQDADVEAASSAAEKRLVKLMHEQGRTEIPALTGYEKQIAQDVIDPEDIAVEFSDIGGLDEKKQEIWELAVLPLQQPELFAQSGLLQAPGGILLYGPPGTGKTMLAKAIAKEAGATFLAVKLSKIMNKWFGESNKLIDAIFSLARKLSPSIIFIDELDTFLNPRDGAENSAGNAIKAEFLTLWDGITTAGNSGGGGPVMVLGATNRPNHVDNAILRRLPRLFRIDLPDATGRLQILRLTLDKSGHPTDATAQKFLPRLAQQTVGYSGSDLKELLNCAALQAVREVMQERSRKAVFEKKHPKPNTNNKKKKNQKSRRSRVATNGTVETDGTSSNEPRPKLRPMSEADLRVALTKVKRTGAESADYDESQNGYNGGGPSIDLNQLMRIMAAQLGNNSNSGPSNNNNNNGDDNIPNL